MAYRNNLPHHTDLPHWQVNVHFTGSGGFVKAMPEDPDKSAHEEHVLDLFVKMYGHLRYGGSDTPVNYKITGRENGVTHQHDYTVEVEEPQEELEIEITRLGETEEVFKAHTLRNTAATIARSYRNRGFFIFLPVTTRPKDLKRLFVDAVGSPSVSVPDMEDTVEFTAFIRTLQAAGEPYIRLYDGATQIHTNSDQSRPLREIVLEAIKKKEAKTYPGVSHSDMILLLDDQLLGYDREYIEQTQSLLAHEHFGSKFKEIYIISRKTSPMKGRKAKSEVMLTPLKAAWYRPLFDARVYMITKMKEGNYLPFYY